MTKRMILAAMGLGLLVGVISDDMSLGLMIGVALSLAFYLFTTPNGAGAASAAWGGAGELESCAGGGGDGGAD